MKNLTFIVAMAFSTYLQAQAIKDSMPVAVPQNTDTASVKIPDNTGKMPVATPDQLPAQSNSPGYNSRQNSPKPPLKKEPKKKRDRKVTANL